jgi:hypothetical protein
VPVLRLADSPQGPALPPLHSGLDVTGGYGTTWTLGGVCPFRGMK